MTWYVHKVCISTAVDLNGEYTHHTRRILSKLIPNIMIVTASAFLPFSLWNFWLSFITKLFNPQQ